MKENFADSHRQMLDAELAKDIKKPPEIEFEIPKKIFNKFEPDSGKQDNLMVKLWDFDLPVRPTARTEL